MREAVLVASGDLRETANRLGWPAQASLEQHVDAVTIFRQHALKAGHLPGNTLQSRLGVATGSFIHVARPLHGACRCDPSGHKPLDN